MKKLAFLLAFVLTAPAFASAQTLQLQARTSFGSRSDGTVRAGDYYWLSDTTGSGGGANLNRGMGFNPLNNHLYIPYRISSPTLEGIHILDGNTGTEVLPSLDISGVTNGGTIVFIKIDTGEDGVIYGMNFGSYPGTTITVYRWNDEAAVATIAFAGNPAVTTSNQWGYTFDVRGAGTNTQILVTTSSANGNVASLLTTADGTNFTAQQLNTDATPGSIGVFGAAAFGPGNTFWAKSITNSLQYFAFDTNAGTATLQRKFSGSEFPVTVGPFGVSVQSNWMAGIDVTTPDNLSLFSITNLTAPPVFLSSTNFPTDTENRFSMGSVLFHSNVVYALDCNNGIIALEIVLSTNLVPPYVSGQSAPQIVPAGTNFLLGAVVGGSPPLTLQWQFSHSGSNDYVNVDGATNATLSISNIQGVHEGLYRLTVANSEGTATSVSTKVFVVPSPAGIITPLFSIAPNSRPGVTDNGGAGTPLQRSLAYNAVSNQLIIVSRTNALTLEGITNLVVDGTTGATLHTLLTNGLAPNGSLSLICAGAADDGAIYTANQITTSGTGVNGVYRLYRYSNSAPTTVLDRIYERQLLSGDATRWGDTMAVRGSGTNTQVLLDNQGGLMMALLRPTDASMLNWTSNGISQLYGGGSIGRSLQFGETNSFWQKRKADRLSLSTYDLTTGTVTVLTNVNNFSFATNLGPVGLDLSRKLLAGIEFATIQQPDNVVGLPDMLVVYEVTDLSNPILIGRFAFPRATAAGNNNWIGQAVFSGDRLYALDGNNGVLAFQIPKPKLTAQRSGSNLTLSWTAEPNWILESSLTLGPSASWSVITQSVAIGTTTVNEPMTGSSKYYRLRK